MLNYVEIGNVDKNNNITYTTIENINEPDDDNQEVIKKILKGDIFQAKFMNPDIPVRH
jgi:hypothetical protein